MTSHEQHLADDRMRAEIAKLIAETAKINREFQWYPFMVMSATIAATAMIVKLFFRRATKLVNSTKRLAI